MKTKVIFFKKKNYLLLSKISEAISSGKIKSNEKIFDIKEISEAKKNDISFFNSYKYINILKKTKAEYVITHKKYETNPKKAPSATNLPKKNYDTMRK